jgi:hypothetical protein
MLIDTQKIQWRRRVIEKTKLGFGGTKVEVHLTAALFQNAPWKILATKNSRG